MAVIGPGRMGQGLALALGVHGVPVTLLGRSADRRIAEPLKLLPPPWREQLARSRLIVIATPDDSIPAVAQALADEGGIGREQVVVHLSGPLDRSALIPLEPSGAALGSFHPLQTIAEPAEAPERLSGAYAAVEGDPRAVEAGRALAARLGMTPVPLTGDAKPRYHAAAVFAANYAVVLAGVAERLATEAGVPAELAGRLYTPLMAGAVGNVDRLGAAAALTGPIRRGDVRTVMAHLAGLDAADQRLYRALGREAVSLARAAGLDQDTARQLEALLSDEP